MRTFQNLKKHVIANIAGGSVGEREAISLFAISDSLRLLRADAQGQHAGLAKTRTVF